MTAPEAVRFGDNFMNLANLDAAVRISPAGAPVVMQVTMRGGDVYTFGPDNGGPELEALLKERAANGRQLTR